MSSSCHVCRRNGVRAHRPLVCTRISEKNADTWSTRAWHRWSPRSVQVCPSKVRPHSGARRVRGGIVHPRYAAAMSGEQWLELRLVAPAEDVMTLAFLLREKFEFADGPGGGIDVTDYLRRADGARASLSLAVQEEQ